MSGLEDLARRVGQTAVVRFIKRWIGSSDDPSSVSGQAEDIISHLPDDMDSADELKEAMSALDGLEIVQTEERKSYLPPRKAERKEINVDQVRFD
jgi:hypothetical protein